MNTLSSILPTLAALLACLFVPGLVVVGIVYWISRSRRREPGPEQVLDFEMTKCARAPDGNILVSPKRGSGVPLIALGLPIIAASVWMLVTDPLGNVEAAGGLILGGLSIAMGTSALTAPIIAIDANRRVIEVRRHDEQTPDIWTFDDLVEVTEWPPRITETSIGFSGLLFVRIGFLFADGSSRNLITTSFVSRARTMLDWLTAAFAESKRQEQLP